MNKLGFCAALGLAICIAHGEECDPEGGVLERPYSMPSKQICVLDNQNTVSHEAVAELVRMTRLHARLPFALNDAKAPLAVELIDADNATTLVIRPEEFKATVNVKALAADKVALTTVVERVEKEIIRAGCYLMGTGYGARNCLTTSIRTLKELDRLDVDSVSGEAFGHMRGGQKNGVKLVQWITYRHACNLGIAPQPTNDVQKTIWDKVHAPPKNPMKIEFDPKKGR